MGAEMAIQRVEPQVSRDEVAAAVRRLIASARTCIRWPSLWIEGEERRLLYVVRFDLMARDWGEDVAAGSRARMQEFVDMGLLTQRDRPDLGPGAAAYLLTGEGARALSGSLRSNMSFCLSPERELDEITELEWGEFECGSLRVNFTHVGRTWPSWASTEAGQRRVTQTWAAIGQAMPGSVTLSRQWYQPQLMPPGMQQNGELRSLCFDQVRRRVSGDDLNLNARSPMDEDGAEAAPSEPPLDQNADIDPPIN